MGHVLPCGNFSSTIFYINNPLTNKLAKYEALILELKYALQLDVPNILVDEDFELDVPNILIDKDFKVVINQTKNKHNKNPSLKKYTHYIFELVSQISSLNI